MLNRVIVILHWYLNQDLSRETLEELFKLENLSMILYLNTIMERTIMLNGIFSKLAIQEKT